MSGYGSSPYGPPPAYPPGYPPPPAYPPPPPPLPPAAGPRDPGTALSAALLNLSGLGAGYLYLRRWPRAVACWAATGALLLAALPVDADGIDGRWVALYAAAVVLFALDAWRLGRPPVLGGGRPPWVPWTAGVLLLALPAAAVVSFGAAQRAALEEVLRERLELADGIVQRAAQTDFASAEDDYHEAVSAYLSVHAGHPGSDAAGQVPERLDGLYEAAVPEDEEGCPLLAPLDFFYGLPDEFDDGEAERLAERAAGELPAALHGCGMGYVDSAAASSASEPLSRLLADFPGSEQAHGLPGELEQRQNAAVAGISGDAPCRALEELRGLGELLTSLPGEDLSGLAEQGEENVPEGMYQCGTDQFLTGDYTGAEETLTEFTDTYPDHRRARRAGDILIAARIAQELPAAGEALPPPPGETGGPLVTLEILNDSPYAVDVLYTGPSTGTESLEPCDGCSVYPDDPGDASCSDSGTDYPSTTLRLPAGDYHFLMTSPGDTDHNAADSDSFDPDYTYTYCHYVAEQSYPGLLDPPDLGQDV